MPRACVIVLDAVGAGALPDASEFGHFAERQLNAFLDPAIRVHRDLAALRPAEAHGKKEK